MEWNGMDEWMSIHSSVHSVIQSFFTNTHGQTDTCLPCRSHDCAAGQGMQHGRRLEEKYTQTDTTHDTTHDRQAGDR